MSSVALVSRLRTLGVLAVALAGCKASGSTNSPPDVIVAVRRVGDGSGRDLLDSVHREDDEILTLLADGDDEDDAGSHVPVRLDDLDTIVRLLYRWQSPTRFEG